MIAVDYTRTVESVTKTGPDLLKYLSKQTVKIDLSPLFSPRAPEVSTDEALSLMKEWNDELDSIEVYVHVKGKKFKKVVTSLEDPEFGHFYSGDNYVISCMYSARYTNQTGGSDDRLTENGQNVENGMTNGYINGQHKFNSHESDEPQSLIDEYSEVYFWQGRNASQMGWLNFTFGLQKEIEANCREKFNVIRMHQQKEDEKFLAHFKQRFIIHQGKRNQSSQQIKPIQLYQVRANGNPLTLRCIEIDPYSSNLNSGFCFILRINQQLNNNHQQTNGEDNMNHIECLQFGSPMKNTQSRSFVWIGSKAKKSEAMVAVQIAIDKLSHNTARPTIFEEGFELPEFWQALGGHQDYDTDASFMNYTRLFRCSNDKGYFCISEERTDFCQDDLSDDDIMILDNGAQVILWIGPKSSEVEIRLAYKSAELYVRDLMKKENTRRELKLTFKGKESKRFTKCFHAWSEHKNFKDPRGDEARFLKQQFLMEHH